MPKEVTATVALLLVVSVGLTGCERGAPPPPTEEPPTQTQVTPDQQQALEAMQKYAQENGITLADAIQRLTQPQAAPAPTVAGPASVQPDLKVLGALLGWARKSATSKDPTNANAWLVRANRMARAILAELPAQQVAVQIERALAADAAQPADTATASAAIGAAIDLLTKTPDQALAPDVLQRLQAVKDRVVSDPLNAAEELQALLAQCASDKAANWAYQITLSLSGATEAVGREAWPVVTAEIEQAEALLAKIGDAATGTPAPAAGTAPAAPKAPAVPPAAGQAPAKGKAGK